MKKFLSLVLALVMTMSLVTVSAGATEYKDFTDKSEIQYEEAVTVLNKLGIITGYSEGDFRPQGELTRGAAAKIIVSLLIGPEAAEALGNETSPYPDVPAGNTFAGVISYCKTAKIISGYGDGTFRPTGTLTGYAFAKMLLGALGYDSSIEGFTGAGWNMNVAKLGGEAGLFDRITFNGNATVNREQACQLALNTLKGTMVEYSGGMNITNGGQSIVVNPDRNYKTSNQEYAQHINNRKAGGQQASDETWYTVEFGEEHFVDLRMEREQTNADAFGRPSNVWSWKKVTIGTFPIEPDYVFTAQTAHLDKSDSEKNRATGLGGFKVTRTPSASDDILEDQDKTRVWINGRLEEVSNAHPEYSVSKTADISDLTDNGTVVEVYVSDLVADFITDVVVIKTQLMEVRRVGSDYVALQREDNKAADSPVNNAYNQPVMDVSVEDIQADDDLYSVVSGLKAGDLVAVVPVAQDERGASTKWDVGDVYVPETVSGALSAVDTYGAYTASTKDPVSVTVGGTKYNIALWSRDLLDINGDTIKVTRKDVTLYLDKNGNAMKIKDAGDVSGWFIVGRYYQTLVENRIVTMVEGWDTSGEKMELNLGTSGDTFRTSTYYKPGDLVRYQSTASNNADWILTLDQEDDGKYHIVGDVGMRPGTNGDIKASDVQIPVTTYPASPSSYGRNIKALTNENVYTEKGVKFVYVTFDPLDHEVESISIKDGVQEVKKAELDASKYECQAAQVGYTTVKGDSATADPDAIKVVVIKQESNDATASNLLYIRDQVGGAIKEADGTMIYCYTVAMMGPNGLVNDKMTIYSDDKMTVDTFAAYTQKEHEGYSDFYDLREHNNFTQNTTSTFEVSLGSFVTENGANVRVKNPEFVKGTGANMVIDGENNKYNGAVVERPYIMRDPRDPETEATENGGESRHIRISSDTVFVDLRTTGQKADTGNRTIDSRDDFKWVFENFLDTGNGLTGSAKVNDWRIDQRGDTTFLMQLVVNDNESNNSFRTVSMVVITDQITLGSDVYRNVNGVDVTSLDFFKDPPPAQTGKDVTLTIANLDNSWEGVAGGNKDVTLTEAQANAKGTITLTLSNGATISGLTKTGTLDYTASTDKKTLTVTTAAVNNDKLDVTVKSEEDAETGATGTTYTFTFKVSPTVVEDDTWTNEIAKTYKSADANGLLTNIEDVDMDTVAIAANGTVSGATILNTGKTEEILEQVQSLYDKKFGAENVSRGTLRASQKTITFTVDVVEDGVTYHDEYIYNYSQDPVLVHTKDHPWANPKDVILAYNAVIDKSSPASGNALWATASIGDGVKVLDAAGENPVKVEKGASTGQTEDVGVVAGYTYINNAYKKFDAITPTDNDSTGLTAKYYLGEVKPENELTADDDLVEADAEIIIVLSNGTDISVANNATLTVTFKTKDVGNIGTSSEVADLTVTKTATSIAFQNKSGDSVNFKANDTIYATYTVTMIDMVTAGDIALPGIEVTNA